MSSVRPGAADFIAHLYGSVFAERAEAVRRLRAGDALILVPDPPGVDEPTVWVHAPGGAVLGHLSPDLGAWMVPKMNEGRRYGAVVEAIAGEGTESWKRVRLRVRLRSDPASPPPS